MRTKVLLGLAAVAVSAATCVAQSNVYSLNIVGYVNVDIAQGLNLIANPLKPSNGNYTVTNIMPVGSLPATAEGAELFTWEGSSWGGGAVWDPTEGWFSTTPIDIQLGEAFFLSSPVATKLTFVGEVATGTINYTMAPGINVVANKVPVAENFPGRNGNEGDELFTWNVAGQSWQSAGVYDPTEGWFGGASPNGPMLQVGQGLIYVNNGPAVNWNRQFNP